LEGLPMAQAIDGLTSTHSKFLGGGAVSLLVAGVTNQLASDYKEQKSKFDELSEKFEKQRDILEDTRTENAVLKHTINSERQNKHLRNFAITMGTGLIGTGIFLSKSQLDKYAYGAYVVGVIFVVFGWLTGPREVK